MNKQGILLFFLTCFMSLPVLAQTDIKSFQGKTPEMIIKEYGDPLNEDLIPDQSYYVLKYESFSIALERDTYILDEFITSSSQFKFLCGIVDGGVKVGDPIQKLQTIDKKYTEDKAGNELKTPRITAPLVNHEANYILFEQDTERFYFYVKDGIIQEIGYFTFPE